MLDGRVAVVTGGRQGLGRAICDAFLSVNAKVCSLDLLPTSTKTSVLEIQCDVASGESCSAAIAQVMENFGRIDILVNCAGVLIRDTLDSDSALAGYDKTMQVNVLGVVNCVRACLPELKKSAGTILNVASIQSFTALRNSFAYNASKGAVLQLTKAMAGELAPWNIRVNGIAPGWMDTPMNKDDAKNANAVDSFLARVPLGRLGHPTDVGGPAVFLCSDMSAYVTGATLPIDGGFLAV